MDTRGARKILESHYEKKRRIEKLQEELKNIILNIEQIKEERYETIQGVSYGETVQTSNIGNSVEKKVLQNEKNKNRIEKDLEYYRTKKFQKKRRIRDIENQCNRVDFIISRLNEFDQLIIKYKFMNRYSNRLIADNVFSNKDSVRRKLNNVLEKIAREFAPKVSQNH